MVHTGRGLRLPSAVRWLALVLAAAGLLTVGSTARASGFSIAPGDLIVSFGRDSGGEVDEYTPSGTFVQTLVSSADGLVRPYGTAFDGQGNLFVADFGGNQILRVDHATGEVTVFSNDTILGDGTSYSSPESIAFSSGFGAMYISDARPRSTAGSGGIHVVDPATGAGRGCVLPLLATFTPCIAESDWLAFDQSGNLYMTNENLYAGVMQVDLTSGLIVSPSFVPDLPETGYAISFDKNGNLWVGDTYYVLEYDSSGSLLRTISNSSLTSPSFTLIFAAVFNPAGDRFYAGDYATGAIWTYDPNGTQLGYFNSGKGGVTGLSVAGSVVTPGVPEGTVAPSPHDFGDVNVGNSSTAQTFTVTSTGTSALAISSVDLAGADPSDFSIGTDTCTGASLDPTHTCTVDVTFTPTAGGTRTAALEINDNTADTPQTAALGGTGVETAAVATTLTVQAATGDFADTTTVSAVLTETSTTNPVAGEPVTLTLDGAETCTATTDSAGTASCSLTPGEAAGTYTLSGSFAGDSAHEAATGSADFVVAADETGLSYTGDTSAVDGQSITLSGLLTTDDPSAGTPLAGKSVELTLGSGAGAQTCSGTTDSSGTASCTIASVSQSVGSAPVSASFAGDSHYRSAAASAGVEVFPPPATGAFAVGDLSAGSLTADTPVYFWGSKWWKQNKLSGGRAPSTMKGFADSPDASLTCGSTWSTRTGDSSAPPASLPDQIEVIVSDNVSKDGSTISGTVVHIVVVQVDSGYLNDPGHPGTGTIVSTVC